MDTLTIKHINKMYSEITNLELRYGKDKAARRMIKAYFEEVKKAETSKDLRNMEVVLISLRFLLKITYPNK